MSDSPESPDSISDSSDSSDSARAQVVACQVVAVFVKTSKKAVQEEEGEALLEQKRVRPCKMQEEGEALQECLTDM